MIVTSASQEVRQHSVCPGYTRSAKRHRTKGIPSEQNEYAAEAG